VDADPLKLLEQTVGDLEGAAFVGKGDCDTVKQLLAVFEWDMRTALARATADYAVTGQTVDAAMRKRAISMKSGVRWSRARRRSQRGRGLPVRWWRSRRGCNESACEK